MRRYLFFPVLLLLVALIAGCNPPTGDTRERIGRLASGEPAKQATPDGKSYQIVVVPQDSASPFEQAVRQGAEDAARKFNAKIIWISPARDSEVAYQKQALAEAVTQKVDGVVLAPADATELVIPVNKVAKARIPIAIFNADVNTKNKLSLVSANNYQAGQLAAQHIGKITGGRGNVVLAIAPGSPFIHERETGFTETIAQKFPQIHVVSATTNLSEVAALFCPDEITTFEAVQTVRDKKLKGKIKIVGFGSVPDLAYALKSGDLDALVQPDPYQMGYESVKAVVDHLQLRDVPRRIDSGVVLITRENMATPQNQQPLE